MAQMAFCRIPQAGIFLLQRDQGNADQIAIHVTQEVYLGCIRRHLPDIVMDIHITV